MKSENMKFNKLISENKFASFLFETKTTTVRFIKIGRQYGAKLSRVVGRVSDLGS
jgi:hypothetical protein